VINQFEPPRCSSREAWRTIPAPNQENGHKRTVNESRLRSLGQIRRNGEMRRMSADEVERIAITAERVRASDSNTKG